uniref:Uncharacterized protein n=1 Tax=Arundo donax TaxID=35708 RepID=A0A0A8ZCZ3_ARUDO
MRSCSISTQLNHSASVGHSLFLHVRILVVLLSIDGDNNLLVGVGL